MGKILRGAGDYLFRALNPVEKQVRLGEIPKTYIGAIVPHAHLWDIHHLEAGIWTGYEIPKEKEVGLVAMQQVSGSIPFKDISRPGRLAKDLILLGVSPFSENYLEILPVKREKDGESREERARYNREVFYGRGGEILGQGGVVLIYPHGENMEESELPWEFKKPAQEGAFTLSAVSGAPILPIAVLQGEKGVLIGSGEPIYPARRIEYASLETGARLFPDEKRALRETLENSYREIYRELGIV